MLHLMQPIESGRACDCAFDYLLDVAALDPVDALDGVAIFKKQ